MYALLLAGALAATAPLLFLNASADSSEAKNHYRWILQVANGMRDGEWFTRWMPLSREGLGEPVFVYYPPLFHHGAALLVLAGFSAWTAVKVVLLIASWASGAVMYANTEEMIGRRGALIAALLFQAAPYPIMMVYAIGTWPWCTSLPLIAFCIFRLFRFADNESPRIDIALAFGTGLLTLTHILSSVMVFCCAVAIPCYVWARDGQAQRAVRTAAWMIASLGTGVSLSAFYVLPAVLNLDLIHKSSWVDAVSGLESSFILPLVTGLRYDVAWPAIQWAIPLLMVSPIVVWLVVFRTRLREQRLTPIVAIGLAAVFFGSDLSFPLWLFMTPLRFVQFPFRFLVVLTIPACIVLADMLVRERNWFRIFAASLALGCMGISVYFQVRAALLRPSHAELFGPALLVGDFETPEYLPSAATKGAERFYPGLAVECQAKELECKSALHSTHHRAWLIKASQPTTVTLPLFSYPGWTVSIDGRAVAPSTEADTGLFRVTVPPGGHMVRLDWTGVPWEGPSRAISLSFVVFLLAVAVIHYAKPLFASHGTYPVKTP